MIRKLLKRLLVIQVVNNQERSRIGLKKLGKGYTHAYRLNPYNPLSHLTVVLALLIGILLFGFLGFWKEVDLRNPFEWT